LRLNIDPSWYPRLENI